MVQRGDQKPGTSRTVVPTPARSLVTSSVSTSSADDGQSRPVPPLRCSNDQHVKSIEDARVSRPIPEPLSATLIATPESSSRLRHTMRPPRPV